MKSLTLRGDESLWYITLWLISLDWLVQQHFSNSTKCCVMVSKAEKKKKWILTYRNIWELKTHTGKWRDVIFYIGYYTYWSFSNDLILNNTCLDNTTSEQYNTEIFCYIQLSKHCCIFVARYVFNHFRTTKKTDAELTVSVLSVESPMKIIEID